MSNTITISITSQDLGTLKENPSLSASKLFRSAMNLWRHREEFLEIYDLIDYRLKILTMQENIQKLQKELMLRNERIDSLQDVLAQKELAERRVRKSQQEDLGLSVSSIAN